ncbi:unnamed protein product [Chrysodeixis includens]|uniref:Uncharacterized protein n=1 Tax=Chrysodeixis includens TaxID=689277 RepID=A0A9N8PZE0_CHRIL|nr:unnamed protein product [Chrysodeixis includens]
MYGYRSKRNKKTKTRAMSYTKAYRPLKDLCVGGKYYRFGSFRFWQRQPCAQRRSLDSLEESELDEFPSDEAGPERNETYEPTYGYEPYWADGDWVFDKPPEHEEEQQEDMYGDDQMCGERCPKMYSEYGKVCARSWRVLYRGECITRELEIYNRWRLKKMQTFLAQFNSKYPNSTRAYVGFAVQSKWN